MFLKEQVNIDERCGDRDKAEWAGLPGHWIDGQKYLMRPWVGRRAVINIKGVSINGTVYQAWYQPQNPRKYTCK